MRTKLIRASRALARGFSLLEVLITMVVVALGLLGVAGMQVASIKLADAADVRSKGVTFVNDIAERILTQPNSAGTYAVSFGGAPAANGAGEADVIAWKASLASRLPSGEGSIGVTPDPSCAGGVTSTSLRPCQLVTISVRWDELRAKRSATGSTPNIVTFTTTLRV